MKDTTPISLWLALPRNERISWLRDRLAYLGFGIETTVNNCGFLLPPRWAQHLDNDEPTFMAECAKKGIEIIITDYEITFKKKPTP